MDRPLRTGNPVNDQRQHVRQGDQGTFAGLDENGNVDTTTSDYRRSKITKDDFWWMAKDQVFRMYQSYGFEKGFHNFMKYWATVDIDLDNNEINDAMDWIGDTRAFPGHNALKAIYDAEVAKLEQHQNQELIKKLTIQRIAIDRGWDSIDFWQNFDTRSKEQQTPLYVY